MTKIYKNIPIIIFIMILSLSKTTAQTHQDSVEIEGNIIVTDNLKPGYRITFNTKNADSIPPQMIHSTRMQGNHFKVKLPKTETPISVSIAYPGYKTINKNIGVVSENYNIGDIELKADTTIQLSEVVVKSSKPFITEKGATTKYGIQGTMLSESGSLRSLIQRLPNLSISGNRIDVLDAYGIETVVLLDNKEVPNINMLDILQSNNIKSIEVDRDPSVQYYGKVVIRIETIKRISDYLYQDIAASYQQGHLASGGAGANTAVKLGKFQADINYLYNTENRKIKDRDFRFMPEDGSDFNLLDKKNNTDKNQEHNVLVNLGYTISDRTNLSLLYNTSFRDNKSDTDLERNIFYKSTASIYNIDHNDKISVKMHNVSLSINHNIKDKGTLTFLTDYAYVKNHSDYVTLENTKVIENVTRASTEIKSSSQLINIMGNYRFSALWGSDINVGAKFNSIISPTTYNYNIPQTSFSSVINDIKTNEQSYKLYFDIQKWIAQRWQLHAGVGYDHTYQNMKYIENNKEQHYIKHFNNIIPMFSVGYMFSNVSFMNFGLSVPFVKPKFEEIIPSMIYKDALVYQSSAPNIKATTSYIFSGIWRYKTLFLSGIVVHMPYFYGRTYERLDNNSYVMKSAFTSFYNQTFSQLTASYSKQWRNGLFIQPMVTFYYRPYFIDGKVSKHKLTYYPMLTFGYQNSRIYAWSKLSYLSDHSNGIQWVETTGFNLDAGITANFFDNKLTLDLSMPNITRNKVPKQYNINGGIKWGTTPIDRDPEYFKINIRYKIFNNEIKSYKQQGNKEELDRVL